MLDLYRYLLTRLQLSNVRVNKEGKYCGPAGPKEAMAKFPTLPRDAEELARNIGPGRQSEANCNGEWMFIRQWVYLDVADQHLTLRYPYFTFRSLHVTTHGSCSPGTYVYIGSTLEY
jgi:hypothetical protein